MSETLREMCKSLRLAYVADIYDQIPYESADQFLEAVFKEEFRLREEAKVQRLIKKAKFLDNKRLANYEWHEQIRFPGHINKEGLQSLSLTRFVSLEKTYWSDHETEQPSINLHCRKLQALSIEIE